MLALAAEQHLIETCDLAGFMYFLARITVARSPQPTMPGWHRRLFLTIAHNSANPVEYFQLPVGRTISMGAELLL